MKKSQLMLKTICLKKKVVQINSPPFNINEMKQYYKNIKQLMMKNRIIKNVILLMTVYYCCSCNKVDVNQKVDMANLSDATLQSIHSGSITALKQSYGLLTNDEKQDLWDTKWRTILKNDAVKLTTEQKKNHIDDYGFCRS